MSSEMLGCEWIIDAHGCDPRRLRDLSVMVQLCDTIIDKLHLSVVGNPTWHQFPGHAGVTGLYLLSESHLACHTYPEVGVATLNLYCCHRIQEMPWAELLEPALHAVDYQIVYLPRGQLSQTEPSRLSLIQSPAQDQKGDLR